MDPKDFIPQSIQSDSLEINPIRVGMSGAKLFFLNDRDKLWVMRIASEQTSQAKWEAALHIEQLVTQKGLCPQIRHIDHEKRVMISDRIKDISFAKALSQHKETLLPRLIQTLNNFHQIKDDALIDVTPVAFITLLMTGLTKSSQLPQWLIDTVTKSVGKKAPLELPPVLSHNDFNPTNILYDGDKLWFIDWESAGLNDPYYDIATLLLFLPFLEEEAVLSFYLARKPTELEIQHLHYQQYLACLVYGLITLQSIQDLSNVDLTHIDKIDDIHDLMKKRDCFETLLAHDQGKADFALSFLKKVHQLSSDSR